MVNACDWSGIGRSFLRSVNRFVPSHDSGVAILGYHLVGADTNSSVDLPAPVFARQLQELRAIAEPCSLADAVRELDGGEPADRLRVVVTFDDAFANFYRTAWPILRDFAIPVTLYVPTGFIERRAGMPLRTNRHLEPMSWHDLETIVRDELVTIGSHGVTHRELPRLTADEMAGELSASKAALEHRLGTTIDSFAYPRGACSTTAERQVARWYGTAVAASGKRNTTASFRPHCLARTPVRRDMPESVATILAPRIWLEEWVASQLRPLRH